MRFSERFKGIPVLEPLDSQAGIDGDSVNMALLHNVVFPIIFGAITGDAVLKFYSGAAPATKTTALAFKTRLSDAVYKGIAADGLGDLTDVASTGLTLTAATYKNKTLVVEFDAAQMTDGEEWLTLELSAAADVLLVSCYAYGLPRYAAHDGPSVLDPA